MKLLIFIFSVGLMNCLLAQPNAQVSQLPVIEGATEAKTTFRRHFLIAFDQSTPFVRDVYNSPDYFRDLARIFSDSSFFNPAQDEISFWAFGIPYADFDKLRRENATSEPRAKISGFYNSLFHYMGSWQAFKKEKTAENNVESFLKKHVYNNYPHFGNGVTLSYLVYPLLINHVSAKCRDCYAKDYRLVILSDFLTGSQNGNKQDMKVLREYLYRGQPSDRNSTAGLVNEEFKSLDEHAFTSEKTKDAGNSKLGILVSRIRPRIDQEENPSSGLSMESNVHLTQKGYASEFFALEGSELRFSHAPSLRIREAVISVSKNGKMLYQKNKVQLGYNPQTSLYSIDDQELRLPAIASGLDGPLTVTYQLLGTYITQTPQSDSSGVSLNYLFDVSQNIGPEDVVLIPSGQYLLPGLVVSAIVIILIGWIMLRHATPRGIVLVPTVLTESLETVDFRGNGKSVFPYQPWTSPEDDVKIPFKARLDYRSSKRWLHWKRTPAIVKFKVRTEPEGFRLALREHAQSQKEYLDTHGEMKLHLKGKDYFSFESRLTQSDQLKVLTGPEKVELFLGISVRGKVWGIFPFNLTEDFSYEFLVGPDLGKVWIGIDPGTTGSCIAVGRHTENILPQPVVPSYLAFDTGKSPAAIGENAPVPNNNEYYLHGILASSSREARYVRFRSVKKLLGFKDHKIIQYANGFKLQLSGARLTGMLMKGIFHDVKAKIEADPAKHDELLTAGRFNPERAVVAVPNNFTPGKIQDMIDAFQEMPGQFKDIRYVYEAEAVLFYSLSQHAMSADSEAILIFDMGGATINVTLVNVAKSQTKQGTKYIIDILGKTGYGIGGDTIDYCFVKVLLGKFPEPWKSQLDPFDSQKITAHRTELVENWLKFIFQLKVQLIEAFQTGQNPTQLISPLVFRLRLREANLYKDDADFGTHLDTLSAELFTRKANRYPIFDEPIFRDLIYNNVRESTQEALALAGERSISKVIFAGRSSHFPLIVDHVMSVVKTVSPAAQEILLAMDKDKLETKYAVAIGACWYGLNKNAIELNNRRIFSNLGIRRKKSAQIADLEFIPIIPAGTELRGVVENEIPLSDTFNLDQNEVHFFQVIGQNPTAILKNNLKHKYSRLTSIPVNGTTTAIGMRLSENDKIICCIRIENSDSKICKSALLTDQLINDANDEHYTWVL